MGVRSPGANQRPLPPEAGRGTKEFPPEPWEGAWPDMLPDRHRQASELGENACLPLEAKRGLVSAALRDQHSVSVSETGNPPVTVRECDLKQLE